MRFAYQAFAARTGSPCHFSAAILGGRPYFFPTAEKSRQKKPLSSKALTPIIDQIMQAAFSRSLRRKAQLAIPAN